MRTERGKRTLVKSLELFPETVMRVTTKKHSSINLLSSPEMTFLKIANHPVHTAKKACVLFFGNALSKSNVLADETDMISRNSVA